MSAPAMDSAPALRRISRRDLAANQAVWRATAGMYAVVSVATVALLIVGGANRPSALIGFLACTLASALFVVLGQPPATDSVRNHVVIASTSVLTALALLAFQPFIETAVAISIFIGPLAAARLDRREPFFAHLLAATGVLLLSGVIGAAADITAEGTLVAIVLMLLAIWCLGISCLIALEAAEAQGDELEVLVRRDPLTGAGNRRMLLERLDDEVERQAATGAPVSVVVLDFDALSDTVGHVTGDELLRSIAAALTGVVGEGDAVVRQGGDEFCLVLAGASAARAAQVAGTVREALEGILLDGRPLEPITAVATCPDDALTRDALLAVADRRLVEHKRGGPPLSP